MARIILHTGLRKTGTTSIQKFLNANRQELDKWNILYPFSGLPSRESKYAHHDLAVKVTGIRPPTDPLCWEKLHEEIRQNEGKMVFISSEIFSVATPEQIEEVGSRLSGHEVIILIYLRNPASFITSLYKAQIKGHGEFRSFRKFLLKKPGLADFDHLVNDWQQVFGKNNVILKNYDEVAKDEKLLQNLIGSLGLEQAARSFSFPAKSNVTPEENIVVMIRTLNWLKKKLPLPSSTKNKIKDMVADLNKGNDRGKILLKRYMHFLPKQAYSRDDLTWLEGHIGQLSCEYKKMFRNDILFNHE